MCILDNYGVTQHVTLDFISKNLNISQVMVTDVALSNHSSVFFEMASSVHTKVQIRVNQKTDASLKTQVNYLFRLFLPHPTLLGSQSMIMSIIPVRKIMNVIDVIAPTTVKVVSDKKKHHGEMSSVKCRP